MEKNETYYGILMNRVLIDTNIYLFRPISIIEGVLSETEFEEIFIDKLNNVYMLSTDANSIQAENENTVHFIITEDELLKKYENLCIEDARNEYYDEISSLTHVGFYILDKDNIKILPFKFGEVLADLNSRYNVDGEMAKINLKESLSDKNDYDRIAFDSILIQSDGNDVICITYEEFENLLKYKDFKSLHDRLAKMKQEIEELRNDFLDEEKQLDFSELTPNDIILMFNGVYNEIIKLDDKDKIIKLIDEFVDNITAFCIYLDGNLENLTPIQDSLYNLTGELEKILEFNDIEKIKTECTRLKYEYKDIILDASKLFDNKLVPVSTNYTKSDIKEVKTEIDVKDMKKFMDEIIIGQEEAKIDVIQAIYMNSLSDNPNDKNSCLLIGPTGSGKTLIAQAVGKYLDKPIVIIDTTQLTMPGYVGADIDEFLTRLVDSVKGDLKKAEEGIVVFDEIDKKGSESNGDISGKGVLNTLLPFLQGTTYDLKINNRIVHFDTSKLTIFATGAFTDVNKEKNEGKPYSYRNLGFVIDKKEIKEDIKYEDFTIDDLSKYGNIPIELLGRFTTITQLSGHTKETLKRILIDSKESALLAEKSKLNKVGIELRWTEGYIDAVTQNALELKTGARSLKSTVEKSIKRARWEALLEKDLYKVIILSQDSVIDNTQAILIDRFGNSHNLKDILDGKNKTEISVIKKLEMKRG